MTAEVVERYGASVWTPPHAVWRKIRNPATTDELPAGIEALELDGEPRSISRERPSERWGTISSNTLGEIARRVHLLARPN